MKYAFGFSCRNTVCKQPLSTLQLGGTEKCVTVPLLREFKVAHVQPALIQVFDYYEPRKQSDLQTQLSVVCLMSLVIVLYRQLCFLISSITGRKAVRLYQSKVMRDLKVCAFCGGICNQCWGKMTTSDTTTIHPRNRSLYSLGCVLLFVVRLWL